MVISGNYNQKGYDRTKWYTIDYVALERLEKEQTEANDESEPNVSGENDNFVGDQSIGTNCPYEENQGFAGTLGDISVSDRSIETKCPHEEN